MKTRRSDSDSVRREQVPTLTAVLLAALLIPRVLMASIQIEEAQREFQARNYFFTGTYTAWAKCPCGMPAPAFPPGGFYGDLDKNKTLAVQLVRDLAFEFYVSKPLYYYFLNTPDGHSGIEGTPYSETTNPVNPYSLPDVSPYVAGADMSKPDTITQANHKECLQALLGYIKKCKCVYLVNCGTTNLAWRSGGANSTSSCEDAKQMSEAAGWNETTWASTWFYQATSSSSDTNNSPTVNWAWTDALRGRLLARLDENPGFTRGTLLLYLACTTNTPAGVGNTTPPVAPNREFHVWQSPSVQAGTPYCSPLLGDGNPAIAGGCPPDDSAHSLGWSMLMPFVVMVPEFKTDPDDVHCGDGFCSSGGCQPNVPGAVSLGASGLSLRISVGLDQYGSPAGYFYLRADQPSQSLYAASSLLYSIADPPKIGFGTDNGGIIWTPSPNSSYQAYVISGSGGFGVYFTNWDSGLPQLVGSVTVAANGGLGHMLVTQVLGTNATPRTFGFNYTSNSPSSGTWEVVQGAGLRSQSCLTVSDPGGNQTKTIQVKDSQGVVAAQSTEQYSALSWGLTLVQQTLGTGNSAQTNTWIYHTDTNSPGSYGQLATLLRPSGGWERYQYDSLGRLTNQVAQFGNNGINTADSANRVTQLSYDDANSIVTTIEKLLNTEVSRTYQSHSAPQSGVEQIQTIRCAAAGAAINHSANLTNILWRTTDTSVTGKAWEPIKELREDGTMVFYSYGNNSPSSGQRTTVVRTGAPNTNHDDVVDGTQTTTVVGQWGQTVSSEVRDIASGLLLVDQQLYTYTDDLCRSHSVAYLDGTTETFNYACCGLYTYTGRDGATTEYTYDAARRQVASTRLGITTSNILDAAGNVLSTIRIGTNNAPPITLRQAAYDLAGKLTNEINALGGATAYSQSYDGNGQTVKTTTYPDGGTRIETYYQDGSLLSIGGTATHPVQRLYGVDNDGPYTSEIKVATGGGTNEWVKTSTDLLGRAYKTLFASASTPYPASLSTYNVKAQLTNQVDPDGVITLYAYNAKGEQVYSVLDSNRNYSIDFAGTDQITLTTNDVVSAHGTTVRRTRTYTWNTAADASMLVSTVESSVDGLQSWQTRYRDPNTSVTSHSQTTYGGNGARSVSTVAPDGSYTTSTYQYGRLLSVTRYDSSYNPVSSISYGYDPYGRQSTVTDARNGTTTLGYNNADLATSVTTPNPGTLGGSAQITLTCYNQMLQATNVVQPDGTAVTAEYYQTGELKKQYGSRTYPVGYGYDYAGRMTKMTNWSGFPSSGARITTWNYNQYRGWLDSKTYDGGAAGPAYTYTLGGRLQTRAWARGVTTTYGYNWAGALASVSYSDSTPAVTTGYDRLGRVASTLRNGITTTMAYNTANEPLSESFSGGTLSGLSVTNGYDQYLRRSQLAALNSTTPFLQHSFSFDNASRLLTVTDNTGSPAYSATYIYLAKSPLVSQIVFKQGTTTRMTTAKQHDYLNRLTSISSAVGSSAIGNSYACNNANQRIRSTLADGSYWLYEYDSLGQVRSGRKYWPDQTPVAGQQFEYTHDDIGNRTATKAGGDQNGANLRSASYLANNLNQYTNRTVPGAVDVMGVSFATNAVTVNGQTAYRKGEYFRKEIPVSNGSVPVWQSITNAATGQASITGNVFVPKTPELFYYDADGNLTNDGCWRYAWDAENRLVTLTTNTAVGPRQSLKFEYDWRGRRIRKQVWPNASWNGTPTNDVKFVYDGWNLLAELNATNNAVIRSFMWGSDLSGTSLDFHGEELS